MRQNSSRKSLVEPVVKMLPSDIRSEAFNIVDGSHHTLQEAVAIVKDLVPGSDITLGPGPLSQSITGLPPEIGKEVLNGSVLLC